MSKSRKSRFGLTQRDMQVILDIFACYPEVEEVHIFGSRAKGSHKAGSDIDLAIMNSGVRDKTLRSLKNRLDESSLPYRVDLVLYQSLKLMQFMDHINRIGMAFYKRPAEPQHLKS